MNNSIIKKLNKAISELQDITDSNNRITYIDETSRKAVEGCVATLKLIVRNNTNSKNSIDTVRGILKILDDNYIEKRDGNLVHIPVTHKLIKPNCSIFSTSNWSICTSKYSTVIITTYCGVIEDIRFVSTNDIDYKELYTENTLKQLHQYIGRELMESL